MNKIKQLIAAITIVFGVSLLAIPHVGAVNALATACTANKGITSTSPATDPNAVCDSQNNNISTIIGVIVNTLLFLIGVLAVIMIIIGGIRYTASGGNETEVKTAKNTILYAVIGLVVALLAYAAVNWVLHLFK